MVCRSRRATLRPRVEILEARRLLSGEVRPNDPSFGRQYGLSSPNDADIDAPQAWALTTGSPATVVAVLDVLGVDTTHPDLYLKMAINQREIPAALRARLVDTTGDGLIDFYDLNSLDTRGQVVRDGSGPPVNAANVTDRESNGRIDAGDLLADPRWADRVDQDNNGRLDDLVGWDFSARRPTQTDNDGHGTHIAGVIAAQTDNNAGIAGISWGARILPLKFSSLDQAVDAIYYAANQGARVISASWGYYEAQLNTYHKGDLVRAINYAHFKGAVFVAAAGNTWNGPANNNDVNAFYPSSFNDLPNLISVAATNSSGGLASFSNVGPRSVTLAAPGQDIYSTSATRKFTTPDAAYESRSGTSHAAPFVAGVVALVAAQHPEYTAQQLVQRVVSTTKPLPGLAGKTVTGGLVDADRALRAGLPGAPTSLTATATGPHTIRLSWTASPSPGITGYKVERSTAGGSWAVIGTTSAGTTTYLDSALDAGTTYSYRIRATAGGLDSPPSDPAGAATLLVAPTVIALDSGGGAAGPFATDAYVTGGRIHSTTHAIDTRGVVDPAPQAVYQTERYGDFTYSIPHLTPGGVYLVRLHFAEIYWDAPGKRRFDVAINGATVLADYDIYARSGGANRAVVESFTATADDAGTLAIRYTNRVGGAKSSGIEVIPATSTAVALDSGGGAAGRFAADAHATGGNTNQTSRVIDTRGVVDPAPQAVYQTERYGDFTYSIPHLTPGGVYLVRLHFAEIYWDAPGKRRFDVAINGATVLADYDIYARSGGANRAVVESFTATADDAGTLAIRYMTRVGGAKSSGIEVIPVRSATIAIASGGGVAAPFVADSYATGGRTHATTAVIDTRSVSAPAPQTVYQTERFGDFTYSIPHLTPGGVYLVRLHFAEIYWDAPGKRRFDVAINGTPVLSHYDIYARAGGVNRAVVESFTATADGSGTLTIRYANRRGGAKSSGIEIIALPIVAGE